MIAPKGGNAGRAALHVGTVPQRERRYRRERTCEQVKSCGWCNAANGGRTSRGWSETCEPGTHWCRCNKSKVRGLMMSLASVRVWFARRWA